MDNDNSPLNWLIGTETSDIVPGSEEVKTTITIRWCLEDLMDLPRKLCSDAYSLYSNCGMLQWKFEVHLENLLKKDKKGFVFRTHVFRVDDLIAPVRGNLQVLMKDYQNQTIFCGKYNSVLPSSNVSNPMTVYMTLWDHRIWNLPDNAMTLELTLSTEDCVSNTNKITPKLNNNSLDSFIRDMKSAVDDRLLSDVVFSSDDGPVSANRFVLSARSPSFPLGPGKNISLSNMVGEYREAFKCFISYLYTGVIGDLSLDITCYLYKIALQYKMRDLVKSCCLILLSKLSTTSVCKILKTAHFHMDTFMKEAAMRYISTHLSDMTFEFEWRQLYLHDNALYFEVMSFCTLQRIIRA